MTASVLIACAGFLLAVLWMDLMFDSHPDVDATAAYYHRATTTSQPRGALIAAVMVTLLTALGVQAVVGESPRWLLGASAVLAGGPILLALSRTVPAAMRLGSRTDDTAGQIRLARRIRRDHRWCLTGMALLLALWLFTGGHPPR